MPDRLEYNYERFVHESFEPLMRFDQSPPLGEVGPDGWLQALDGDQTTLHELVAGHDWTVVEFGSFT